MKVFKLVSLLLVLTILLPITSGFSKSDDGIITLKAYLKSLEIFNLNAAYNFVDADEKKYKKLEEFTKENPVLFLKAMRLENKNFLKFKIVNEAGAKPDNIIVETTDLSFPDPDVTYVQIYQMLKMESKRKKKKVNLKTPAGILKAFKGMMKKSGMKKIPFKTVKKKMSVVKVKNNWYVKPGWKEEVLAKQEQEKAREMEQKKQRAEFDARSVAGKASFSGIYTDIENAVSKLKELGKLAPDSKLIKDELARLSKIKDNYKKVTIKALEIKGNIMGKLKKLGIEVKNDSKLTVETYRIEYSLLDANGKVLNKVEDANIYGSDTFDPPVMGGLKPGKSGKKDILVSVDASTEKWAKTEIKLISIHFAR